MKTNLRNILFGCFLLLTNLAFSQPKSDIASTSRFVFPQFTDGIVIMNDGSREKTMLNYDASTDQMLFMGADKVAMSFAEPEKIQRVVIQNRSFYYIKGFFTELVSDGAVALYARIHQQEITEKNGAYGGPSPATRIETVSNMYRPDGQATRASGTDKEAVLFTKSVVYYLTVNGKTKLVSNQNNLLKCFSTKKDVITQEMNKQDVNFTSIDSVKKFIDWMNANGIKN
jgi:hypothetical protein